MFFDMYPLLAYPLFKKNSLLYGRWVLGHIIIYDS